MNHIVMAMSVDPSIEPAEMAQQITEILQREAAKRMENPPEKPSLVFTAPIIDAPPEAQIIAIISRLFAEYDRAAISPDAWDRIGIFARNYTTEKRMLRGVPTAATN
jgi:hypothetical protein